MKVLFGLLVIAVILIFVFGGSKSANVQTSPAPVVASPAAKGAFVATPKADAPLAVAPAVLLVDQLAAAQIEVKAAKDKLDAARAATLASLSTSPEYLAAKAESDRLETKVKALRIAGDADALSAESAAWIAAKGKRQTLEQAATAQDAAVIAATQSLAAANASAAALRAKVAQQRKADKVPAHSNGPTKAAKASAGK